MMKFILLILMSLLILSCNNIRKDKSFKDSLSIGHLSFSDNFKFLDSCDIDPVPDSILQNTKKIYRYFINSFVKKTYFEEFEKGFNGFKSDSMKIPDYNYLRNSGIDFNSLSKGLFYKNKSICSGDFRGYIFFNAIQNNKNYDFIKEIFKNKIFNTHSCELMYFEKEGYLFNHGEKVFENYKEFQNSYCGDEASLYNNDPLSYFSIDNFFITKYFTAFFIKTKNEENEIYLICTYNNDGEFIDGIETGQHIINSIGGYWVPPGMFYSYFDKQNNYYIVTKTNISESDHIEDNSRYREITRSFRYKLTNEGKFVLISRTQKKESKSIQ
ncbi:hypothetical protein [Pseudopedobacter beijingensis]|uniref:DKNYY family protein n=1 Tax=Pseudopedobacter beijingensis TaxID=1207056 RepID=A0ABW4IEH5_9SPHI